MTVHCQSYSVAAMTNHEVREARWRARIKTKELAAELGCDAGAVSRHELYGVPLPRGATPSDAIAAIERIVARREAEASKTAQG